MHRHVVKVDTVEWYKLTDGAVPCWRLLQQMETVLQVLAPATQVVPALVSPLLESPLLVAPVGEQQ